MAMPSAYASKKARHRAYQEVRSKSRLLERDAAGFERWATPDGEWWIPPGQSDALFLVLGEQASRTYGTSDKEGVRAGDIVLDCGAHIGSYTRQVLTQGAQLVVAIEPAPENVECLRRNFVSEIAAGRVVVCPKGVWDREDALILRGSGSLQHSLIEGQERSDSVKVPLTTIDALIGELKLKRVDFIKMDIEGAEVRAISGAYKTLKQDQPRLALAGYHNLDDPERISSAVFNASAAYQMKCGPCTSARGLRPEVLFFDVKSGAH